MRRRIWTTPSLRPEARSPGSTRGYALRSWSQTQPSMARFVHREPPSQATTVPNLPFPNLVATPPDRGVSGDLRPGPAFLGLPLHRKVQAQVPQAPDEPAPLVGEWAQ